jgi:hypothetical protein
LSDPEQDPDPGDPLHFAPRRLRDQADQADPATAEFEKVDKALSALRMPYENLAPPPPIVAPPPPMRAPVLRSERPPNIFAEALARAEREQLEREQLERELIEEPEFFPSRPSLHILAKFVIAISAAALGALTYVVVFPTSQSAVEDTALWGLPTWQALKSSWFPAPLPKLTPTLMVRDNSGSINELLEFGVNVVNPAPGMNVIIKNMPPGAKLTAGTRLSTSEWGVPAQDIADAVITPPTDFTGEMNLSAELRGADGAALVTTFVRLTWTAPPVRAAVATAPSSPAPQEPPQVVAPPPPAAAAVASSPAIAAVAPPPAPAEPIRELSPNEIAGLVRRAQELLASGDLQAARLQLTRAAEAHDPRAALLLAKTFDPMTQRQYGAADPGPDLAQARNWYQRAREWGSPEAQRQLDALASYPRR